MVSMATAIYSYEHFLAAHNPVLRKSHGVFYTPQPAVNYIVRGVDEVLREEFNLQDGIADNVQILDPAMGTGFFFAEVIRQVYARFSLKYGQKMWNNFAANDLLSRLHGFEVLKNSLFDCPSAVNRPLAGDRLFA